MHLATNLARLPEPDRMQSEEDGEASLQDQATERQGRREGFRLRVLLPGGNVGLRRSGLGSGSHQGLHRTGRHQRLFQGSE